MFDKIKTSKNFPKARSRFFIFLMIILVCGVTTGAVYDATAKKITINEINVFENVDNSKVVKTRTSTVGELLNENNISIGQYDNLNAMIDEELSDNTTIRIRRGRAFKINTVNGEEFVSTTKLTVKEALIENGIEPEETDEIIPEPNTPVTENMDVSVIKVVKEEITQSEEIPFETITKDDNSLYKGDKKVTENGSVGTKETVYHITYKNGIEVSREPVSETIIKEPVNKVVLVGTKQKESVVKTRPSTEGTSSGSLSSRGDLRYKKKITVTATAYDPSPGQNGGHSKTALGMVPRFGVVAVDPSVIPLGSRIYVESPDGGSSWTYGYAIAGDTGGAIKGNRIDLCYNSNSQALAFGRRSATVYVLE